MYTRLLNDVYREIKSVELARERYGSKLSPAFSCFEYIAPKETMLSKIIADILNPKGNHAQGSRFLQAFLEKINLKNWHATNKVIIECEIPTGNNRRFDILITWTDTDKVIVIENKPYAHDLDNQVSEYISSISTVKDWHFIYLTTEKRVPIPKSISAEELYNRKETGNYSSVQYEIGLIEWLNDCRAICDSERYRWFLGEFRDYILQEFKGVRDMVEQDQIIEQVLNSGENLQAALEIGRAIANVKKKLIASMNYPEAELRGILTNLAPYFPRRGTKHGSPCGGTAREGAKRKAEAELRGIKPKRLTNQLEDESKKDGITIEKNDFEGTVGWNFFLAGKSKQTQPYFARFQFEGDWDKKLIFGICRASQNTPHCAAIIEIMKQVPLRLGIGKNPDYFSWWEYVSAEYRDWKNDSNPWVKIHSGELAKWMMNIVKVTYDAFNDPEKLNLLFGQSHN